MTVTDLAPGETRKPWPALWALVIGFFMILVDQTIVSVAMPHIMTGLDADISQAVWVTSAYLLAFAVPLLITGRLGDRFGPKNVYLVGLVIFTLSSAWCGLAPSIDQLILARIVQGLGASLMTPQTMSVITRMFPPKERGAAMGLWGGIAGVATLVGPLLGGFIIDALDWRWIFFINLPVGVVALVAVIRLVPQLTTHRHSFDILGVVLSAVGMLLVVYGVQEGAGHGWGAVPLDILGLHLEPNAIGLVVVGIVVMAAFVAWQALDRDEPLVPLRLFRTRDFALANIAIAVVGFIVTSFAIPLMLSLQAAEGLSPTQAALLLVPMALISGGLSPFMGRFSHGAAGKWIAVAGLAALGLGLWWYAGLMMAHAPVLLLLLPAVVLGFANAFMWAPLSMSATRDLPLAEAGAGSGVYNTMRQLGAVIGSAAIAATMDARLTEQGLPTSIADEGGSAVMPAAVADAFETAMGQSLLLPAALAIVGVVAAALLRNRRRDGSTIR